MGPNKELTNIDSEIKEAEEFLSEDQISIIRSIVVGNEHYTDSKTDETEVTAIAATSAAAGSSGQQITSEIDNQKWNNLKPTLRSLGMVKETPPPPPLSNDEDDDDEDEDDDYLSDEVFLFFYFN